VHNLLNGPFPRLQGYGVTIDTIDVLYAQLTRDLFAIAKFVLFSSRLYGVMEVSTAS